MKAKLLIGLWAIAGGATAAHAQAWKNCIPNSIGPGGCNSIAPGGGRSIAPGGGQSIAPGGGRSIAPGGGQSIAPGGGRSIAPDGGLSSNRNWNRGLDPNTLQPAPGAPNLPGGRRNDSGSGSSSDSNPG
jgi:hypothetical protein